MPAIPNRQTKHLRAMLAQDSYVAEAFPQPPSQSSRNIFLEISLQQRNLWTGRFHETLI